ncbi:unnamed protein product [Colletotrichum noveboracense]|uniref:Uncharacterized protein n=1 Tax=Colletotrichum noveboracense TaxID=2664923 RepID=A0A9W4RYW0_9PEZI|nr:unnamed protein product [Colletotrichum noveboracense]
MLYETFPADRRLFESRSFLSGLGNRVAKHKINDEKALEYFLHNSVEHPVRTIMDELKNYHAERLTAAAITQTYHNMIEGGLEYGLLTTGEAIVFLRIDWAESETLLYHLAEPTAEVQAYPDHAHLWTAVGQYLAFSLMAVGLPGQRKLHGQDERRDVMKNLKTWLEDIETTLRSLPDGKW